MSSNSKFAMFKSWYKLAEPSKRLFLLTLATACIPAIFYVLEPIATAKVVTFLTEANYSAAMIWLAIGFGFIVLRNVSWHVNYWNFDRLIGDIYERISMKIYDKIVDASDENFKHTSQEKIINIISSDIYTVSEFADTMCTKLSYIFRAIVTIIIVFTSSPIAGGIIIGISILNFFFLNLASKKIALYGNKIAESKDKVFEHMTDVTEARSMIRDQYLKEAQRNQYRSEIGVYIENRHKRTLWNSFVDNWVYVIWQAIVCVTTIYLVYMISGENLTLTTYLVIVGYLAPTIEKINSGVLIFKDLSVAGVSSGRIQTILDFSPKEFVEYGSRMTNNIDGTIQFIDVSVNAKANYHTEDVNDLKNFSVTIEKNDLVLICGQKGCGKRSIFQILRRAIKPDKGKVVLDGIDLYEFSPKVHAKNISYTTHKPYFFKGTVLTNLQMATHNKKKIIEMTKFVGLYDFIDSLPQKFETPTEDIEKWPAKQKYLLGIARALLFEAEVLIVYEFPSQLSQRDRVDIIALYRELAATHTIIVFASQDDMKDIATKTVYISRGTIERIETK